MGTLARNHVQALAIAGADNTKKTITVQPGPTEAPDVLVSWGAGADGTLTLSYAYLDKDGANEIELSLASPIALSGRHSIPEGRCPTKVYAQRSGSTAGTVTVALLPRDTM